MPTPVPLQRFPGGLRLDPRKIASSHGTLRTAALPARLYVPLLQHLGEPAKATVEPGQRVAKGERIGAAQGLLSAHVHAPTSGTVVAIVDRDIGHPSRRLLPCVELIPDGEERWQRLPAWPDWRERAPAAVTARLREAGVVGLGGGVFPTDVKLAAPTTPVRTLIINGAECEPYIACDDALLRHRAEQVLAGAALLRHALGAQQCLLAIEDSMIEAVAAVRGARTPDAVAEVGIVAVPTRYPQGGERQLIATLTGIEVSAGQVPRQHGVVCINVGTAAAAWRAVVLGEALVSRIVSITGPGVSRPANLDALFGTPVAHLIESVGGYTASAQRLLLGGAMMGQALSHDQVPIGKSANCVLVLAAEDLRAAGPSLPCIRCGECARVCPARLLPQQLHRHIQAEQWPQVQELGLADCIECGLCAHVCPSHIPLVESFRFGKGEVNWQAREQARAELSRQRHEARAQRLRRLQEARAERLRAREANLATTRPDATASVVAAALARARQHQDGGATKASGPDDA